MKLSKLIDLHNLFESYDYDSAWSIGDYLKDLCDVSEESPIDMYQNASFKVCKDGKVKDILNTVYRLDDSELIVVRFRHHTYNLSGGELNTNKEEHDQLLVLGNNQTSIDDFVKDLTEYVNTELNPGLI